METLLLCDLHREKGGPGTAGQGAHAEGEVRLDAQGSIIFLAGGEHVDQEPHQQQGEGQDAD